MSNPSIYHNPRCSKSRQTLQLLQDNGITPTIIEYLKVGVSHDEVQGLLSKLNLSDVRLIMRTKDTEYKAQQLGNDTLSVTELIDAIVACPKLLERPIVVNNNQAAIGRPPEAILDII